ncbi:hypothetical protein KIL84_002283 [Mauremys mutica]|uniref:Uncharacterized protein n=1 Tax=Mauremys mutica TaxID=74926 RepID=A0A9D3X5C3_9SAUR|nr:hypothetical protein KIL84_002283 [Mauremys mutica]
MQEIKRNLLLQKVEADWKAHGPFPSTGMVFGSRGGSGYCFPPHPPRGLLDDHGGGRESPSAPPHSSQTQAAHPASSISSPWATPHSQGSRNHPTERREGPEMRWPNPGELKWHGQACAMLLLRALPCSKDHSPKAPLPATSASVPLKPWGSQHLCRQ